VIHGFLFCLAVGPGISLPHPAPTDDYGGVGGGACGGGSGASCGALPFPIGFQGFGIEEGVRSEDHCSSSSDKICPRFCLFV